jgi:hypothetical protein
MVSRPALYYKKGCTRLAATSDKVYQLLAHGRWFSPDTPASSTTKTGRHDIAEILLKVALKDQKSINQSIILPDPAKCSSPKEWTLRLSELMVFSAFYSNKMLYIYIYIYIYYQHLINVHSRSQKNLFFTLG